MTPPPSPENPKPSLEEQITDSVYKILMVGGVGAGGVGAFWQLFKESDIPKAIVSAVIGAGISYGAAILQPIHKGNQQRLGKLGADVNKEVDEITDDWMTRWKSSDFEGKYLICQQLDCEEDDPAGVREDEDLPIHHPLLQEIFVPLELSGDVTGYSKEEIRSLQKKINEESMQIWQLLKCAKTDNRLRQISIRAIGGYGKTTLLKHLAYIYSIREYPKYKAPKFIPFLIYLASCWKEITQETSPTLPDLLSNFHISRLPQGKELKVPPNWAKNLLNQGEALVLLDGFDEIPPGKREKASQWLTGQMKEYPKSVFILTSRPTAYQEDYTARKLTANFWIKDFNEDQRKQFVEQWYRCQERRVRANRSTPYVEQKVQERSASLLAQIEARPELERLAGNPLLLNMMARFHRSRQGAELPDRKVELYQDICELQLGRRPKAKGLDYLLLNSIHQRQEVLQRVALEMMKRATPEDEEGFKQIEELDLLQLLKTALVPFDPNLEPTEFLKQLVQVSEFLVHKDGRTSKIYQFSHLSFQEFLAAAEIVRSQQLD
ncbi:MAG: NACHT domain-containing protein, partial [Prochlorotrichaceae cyanobacterium]